MPKETNTEEILQAIGEFAEHTEKRFDKIDQRFDKIGTEQAQIKAQMVTKDYLDDKLSDLRGDLVVLTRKEDHKVSALVDILKQKKVLTDDDVKKLMSMEPFPQIT